MARGWMRGSMIIRRLIQQQMSLIFADFERAHSRVSRALGRPALSCFISEAEAAGAWRKLRRELHQV